MADQVQADYEQLGQVASTFANQSQAIQELLQRVRGGMEQLEDRGWIGLGSDAFFAEMQGVVVPAVQRLNQALDDGARMTNQIAQTLEQAEHDAESLFG